MLSEPMAAELLASLSTLIRTSRAVAAKTHGSSITGTQISVLKVLAGGQVRMGDLAGQLLVAPSVASRVVATLEHEGLVQRHPDPADARACLLELTELGRERLTERQRSSLGLIRQVLADWTDEEAEVASRSMSRLESRIPDFTARILDQPALSRHPLPEPDANGGPPITSSRPPAVQNPNHQMEQASR